MTLREDQVRHGHGNWTAELDASISKESKWDEEHRTKSNRKRPPDHGASGASPMKQSMPTTQAVDR